jgi:hypothetical protein
VIAVAVVVAQILTAANAGREVSFPGREVSFPGREVCFPGREVSFPGREVNNPSPPSSISAAERTWNRILAQLDSRRTHAWRTGRPRLLAAVWTASSTGLAKDRRLLAAYTRRGMRVDGASLEFARVEVASRTPYTVRLRTIDRLRSAVAVRPSGTTIALPQDSWSRHLVTLRRTPTGWRLGEVEAL